jgi:hypothetical protein
MGLIYIPSDADNVYRELHQALQRSEAFLNRLKQAMTQLLAEDN